MFGGSFSWAGWAPEHVPLFVRLFVAALGTGIGVKLMDDVLDSQLDRMRGLRNLADRLGRAAMPYAMAALAIGLYFDSRAGLALFLAAYSTGMVARPYERLPSGLRAWHEMVAACLLLFLLAGWRLGGQALLALVAIQLLDDVWDRSEGPASGPWAWMSRTHELAALLLAAGCMLAAIALGYVTAFAVLLAAACVWVVGRKRRWLRRSNRTMRHHGRRQLR